MSHITVHPAASANYRQSRTRPNSEEPPPHGHVGDGTHKLPIKSDVRKAIGRDVGDQVTVKVTTVSSR